MKININKIGRILLIVAFAAIAVFILCIIIRGPQEDDVNWRVFSVCLPVAGVCFTGAVIAAIIDYTKRR